MTTLSPDSGLPHFGFDAQSGVTETGQLLLVRRRGDPQSPWGGRLRLRRVSRPALSARCGLIPVDGNRVRKYVAVQVSDAPLRGNGLTCFNNEIRPTGLGVYFKKAGS